MRQTETARSLAERLGSHPAVTTVRYPGFGGVLRRPRQRLCAPRRDEDAPDPERDQPRRNALEARVAPTSGGRSLPARPDPLLRRSRRCGSALGRPRPGTGARVGVTKLGELPEPRLAPPHRARTTLVGLVPALATECAELWNLSLGEPFRVGTCLVPPQLSRRTAPRSCSSCSSSTARRSTRSRRCGVGTGRGPSDRSTTTRRETRSSSSATPGTLLAAAGEDAALDAFAALLPRLRGRPQSRWDTRRRGGVVGKRPSPRRGGSGADRSRACSSMRHWRRSHPAGDPARASASPRTCMGNVLRAEREPWLAIDPATRRRAGVRSRSDRALGRARPRAPARPLPPRPADGGARAWTASGPALGALAQTVAWTIGGDRVASHVQTATWLPTARRDCARANRYRVLMLFTRKAKADLPTPESALPGARGGDAR